MSAIFFELGHKGSLEHDKTRCLKDSGLAVNSVFVAKARERFVTTTDKLFDLDLSARVFKLLLKFSSFVF